MEHNHNQSEENKDFSDARRHDFYGFPCGPRAIFADILVWFGKGALMLTR